MKIADPFEKFVPKYQTTWLHIPEDRPQSHIFENVKFYMSLSPECRQSDRMKIANRSFDYVTIQLFRKDQKLYSQKNIKRIKFVEFLAQYKTGREKDQEVRRWLHCVGPGSMSGDLI
jgi:hypothetical protein